MAAIFFVVLSIWYSMLVCSVFAMLKFASAVIINNITSYHHRTAHTHTPLAKVCNAHVMINIDKLFGVKHRNTANQTEKEEVKTTHRFGSFHLYNFLFVYTKKNFINFSKVHFYTIATTTAVTTTRTKLIRHNDIK